MAALQKRTKDERKQSRYPKQFIEEEVEDIDIVHSPDDLPEGEMEGEQT